MFNRLLFFTFTIIFFAGCKSEKQVDPEYINEIESWKETRVNNLTQPDSWLSLTGLFWLEPGDNTFGTDKSNKIVFPAGAPFMGVFTLKDSVVTFLQAEADLIGTQTEAKDNILLESDLTGNPTLLTYKSLTFYLIDRNGKMGIRLKDSQSEVLKNFTGLSYFPTSPEWRVKASFRPYDPPKRIVIPSIIGTSSEEESTGKLVFSVENKEYSLDVLPAGNNFFIIFADKTSGEETYGAGRFLSVNGADSLGNYYIDFNKAYNPPCAFTKFATCPLPPKDNYLKLAVEAGEKKFH